jgi:hypothetical protein
MISLNLPLPSTLPGILIAPSHVHPQCHTCPPSPMGLSRVGVWHRQAHGENAATQLDSVQKGQNISPRNCFKFRINGTSRSPLLFGPSPRGAFNVPGVAVYFTPLRGCHAGHGRRGVLWLNEKTHVDGNGRSGTGMGASVTPGGDGARAGF